MEFLTGHDSLLIPPPPEIEDFQILLKVQVLEEAI